MLLLANTPDPPAPAGSNATRPGWPAFASDIVSGWLGGASIAESWVGYPPFTSPGFERGFNGWPASLAEAAQRPIYTVVNQRRSAAGATYFGSVGVVFNRSFASRSTLIAAIDTGEMEGQCNASWLQALCGAAPAQANQTSCHERTWFCGWDDSQHKFRSLVGDSCPAASDPTYTVANCHERVLLRCP